MTGKIEIDGQSLTVDDVARVARGEVRVELSAGARTRMNATRRVVEGIVARHEVVYGVTTGFGKLSEVAIPPDRLAELQVNLVRSHAAGVGPLLPEREVRAMMLLRANVIAKGYSGARADLADLLLAMLNAGVWPPVPEQGSVGASGDLAPLAHLALALIGEGVLIRDGRAAAARDVLREVGLSPVTLGPKEGITLINGTQAHTAVAALALVDAHTLWQTAHVAGAMSLEALLGTPVAFDPRIQDARGQLGQAASAALLRELLRDSQIRESHRHDDPRVQDAYALRCMPQVHGPVLDAIDFAAGVIGRELNAATDNPLVFENGEMLSGGNFHGQSVAMVLDFLAIAMTNLATIAERRIDRLVHPELNQGMPAFLSPEPGVNSGFMMAQVTAASLASECKVLSHPASVDTIPTDGSKEDVVPMAMGAAWKLRRIVQNVRHILAIELMCGAQGIDCRAPLTPGRGVARAHRVVRSLVAPLGADRVLAGDIATLADAVADARFTSTELAS
ncbi:MAG: histidine ammonia-lyase [Gemmatimonadaceae bacterium]|nr:histidine ammonia-lyase [Gemmatimonadaceae bacterium]NUQ93687.1 histidine ammonia-lyase [Gemmatimonadaceae bacterium]NUR20344.1 histidine ammonia-lyase [Gemmatimonadaceae bacterium]